MPTSPPDISFPNLGINLNRVPMYLIGNDPDFSVIYFSWFPMNIYLYAVSIVIGITAAYLIGIWHVKNSGQSVSAYTDLLLLGVPLAIVGLRIYYMVFNWDMFRGRNVLSAFFDIRDGGLAIFGGIIGAAIAAAIMGRKKNIPFALMADTGAPSMLLGQVIGRFGNFFNREAFGSPSDGVFAMQIRVDQARYTTPELLENVVYVSGVPYFQVHPTFIYEAAFNFVLMIALILYRPRKTFDGEIVLMYFMGYGIIRFFVESLRTDQMIFMNTGLPLNQITSVLFAVVSGGLIIAGHLRARNIIPASTQGRKR